MGEIIINRIIEYKGSKMQERVYLYNNTVADKYKNKYECNIWNDNGCICLLSGLYNNLEEYEKDKKEVIEKYSKGLMRCCDCGKWMPIEENLKHRYFAGIYCEDCWENNGWRYEAENESYN